jgi:drug/metabolite transporter (DMT)-like permease
LKHHQGKSLIENRAFPLIFIYRVQGIKLGALYLLSCFGTVGLIFSLNAGGKIGPVSVIVELSIILSVLIGVFLFQEHLNPWQIIGILMAIAGVGLVIFFEGR